MTTATVHATVHPSVSRPRHLLGNAVRTARVLAGAAFDVLVLGRTEPGRTKPAAAGPDD